MTVTSFEVPTSAQEIVVRDEYGPLTFVGETVTDLSWTYDAAYERGHSRWTDLTLYRVCRPESEWTYVVQVVGRSVRYHRVGGSCHQGVNVPVGLLRNDGKRYEALEACDILGCQPVDLDDLGDRDIVSVEEDLYSLIKCTDAANLVVTLNNRGNREKKSKLSMKLLQAASRVDEDIAEAMRHMRRL